MLKNPSLDWLAICILAFVLVVIIEQQRRQTEAIDLGPQPRSWNLSRSVLRSGSLWSPRPPFWSGEGNYIVAAAVTIEVESLLIFGLLWQRVRNRKAGAILRQNAERLRATLDGAPSLIWMCNTEGKVTYLNEKGAEFRDPTHSAECEDRFSARVHPDDLTNVLNKFSLGLERHVSFSMEYRLRGRDGVYRWMLDVASPGFCADGSFSELIGSALDITEQKPSREMLERLSGRLIELQEKRTQPNCERTAR